MHTLELPYPPSLNHYYRRVGPRTLISRDGRRYRERLVALLRALHVRPLDGALAVTVELYPPDRRRRDQDNAAKALLDALQHGGAYHDDAQITEMHTYLREPLPPHGQVIVRIAAPCS